MTTNEELIGRAEINDLEAILSISNKDVDETIHAVKDNADAIFTWDYEKGAAARAQQALREGQDVAVERRDRSAVGHRGRPGAGRAGERRPTTPASTRAWTSPARRSRSGPTKDWIQLGIESQNWTLSQFMHGEQGALAVHRQDRRDRAVDRCEVLRVDAGDGRGSPRRGVRQVPRHQAVRPLPDQRPPEDAARRHRQRQPVGHDLPRHADHGRGPRAGRVRVHPPAHDRAAAEAAAALRHERRSSSRRVRRAVAEGVLRAS